MILAAWHGIQGGGKVNTLRGLEFLQSINPRQGGKLESIGNFCAAVKAEIEDVLPAEAKQTFTSMLGGADKAVLNKYRLAAQVIAYNQGLAADKVLSATMFNTQNLTSVFALSVLGQAEYLFELDSNGEKKIRLALSKWESDVSVDLRKIEFRGVKIAPFKLSPEAFAEPGDYLTEEQI